MLAVIIGSGFSGLGMAIALKRSNIDDFVILEKADSVGGTWRENVYPGCACDVPSHVYSFSFEPNPRWSATYSPQPEIRAYIEHCTDKYDLRRHIRFGTAAAGAELDEKTGTWAVTTSTGESLSSRVIVSGVGPLHRWSFPDIPGRDSFKGKMIHSAEWDHSFDPAGKRIATIGTGASAIQFIPELARTASRLHVFQRTPAWVMPRRERLYTELEKAAFERIPRLQKLHREGIFWGLEVRAYAFLQNPNVLRLAEKIAIRNIHKSVKDPILREKLTPSYRMGCKRILLSNTYYPALAQPNVEVITDGIREITETGIVGSDGVTREVDAIVFGTGFDVHDYLGTMRVRGLGGEDLGERWAKEGAQAHLGIMVSGFPNLFLMTGPNTGLGHNSVIYMIEAQVAHIMDAIKRLRESPGSYLDVRQDAQRAYNEEIQQRLSRTVWNSGCASWYRDSNGRNTTLWPGFCFQYKNATQKLDFEDYRLVPCQS